MKIYIDSKEECIFLCINTLHDFKKYDTFN